MQGGAPGGGPGAPPCGRRSVPLCRGRALRGRPAAAAWGVTLGRRRARPAGRQAGDLLCHQMGPPTPGRVCDRRPHSVFSPKSTCSGWLQMRPGGGGGAACFRGEGGGRLKGQEPGEAPRVWRPVRSGILS